MATPLTRHRRKLTILTPFLLVLMLVALVAISFAQEDPVTDATFVAQDDLQLTIYREGFAIVTDVRTFELSEGRNRVVFDNVNDNRLSPNTVVLEATPGLRLLQLSFEPETRTTISTTTALLEQSLDQTVTLTVERDDSTQAVTGIVRLVNASDVLLETEDGRLQRINQSDISGYDLPIDVASRSTPPRLSLLIDAETAGPQPVAISYIMTEAPSWRADYTLRTVEESTDVSLNGWVEISNFARAFEDVRIALAGGNVDAVQFVGRESNFGAVPTATGPPTASATPGGRPPGSPGPAIPSDLDFLLELPGTYTLPASERVYVDFLVDLNLRGENVFVYDASPRVAGFTGFIADPDYGFNNQSVVQNFLEIGAAEGEGIPLDLPGGPLTIYQQTTSGITRTLGTTALPFTPAGVVVQVYLDNSPVLQGSRTQGEFVEISPGVVQETVNISLTNAGTSRATVTIPERLTRSATWEILGSNTPFEPLPNNLGIEYTVEVAPGETVNLSYQVLYRQ
jgi:hypothetical protein